MNPMTPMTKLPSLRSLSCLRSLLALPCATLLAIAFAAGAWFAPGDAQADGPPAAAAPGDAPIDLTAKLVEIPSKLPPDELYDYAYVMRYQVVGGPRNGEAILVAHYKPRLPRAGIKDQMKKFVSGKVRSFHPGDVHKLRLAPNLKSIWKGALVDEFAATDRKSIRYFALVTDPA
jgi:hypothetical protein